MYNYKVIDIHPRDAWHESKTDEPVRIGDVISSEIQVELSVWDYGYATGYSYGAIGNYVFHAIKLDQITNG
jgi:hypothetical protein